MSLVRNCSAALEPDLRELRFVGCQQAGLQRTEQSVHRGLELAREDAAGEGRMRNLGSFGHPPLSHLARYENTVSIMQSSLSAVSSVCRASLRGEVRGRGSEVLAPHSPGRGVLRAASRILKVEQRLLQP